ncbi:hypothetical protein [Streptomyces marispadix]|uniref:Integral membrane protein n=1 Tax=Streptomyces marispadix TaxID=2922868 RepID=A0ABS9SYL0_9ACTN|nr:hypothetical protein [Streptomyces marispadix]MCH6161288.1 hypothetical protein [Streptomyces marispadix]
MKTSVPEATVRRGMVVLGVAGLAWTLLHAGLTALALTTGPTAGSTTEALRVVTYSSPLLMVLSFCGASLAFSGRTARRRPGLAGAAFLVLALVCAVLVAACAALLIRHAGLWALPLLAINFPLLVVTFVCRRSFRSAQRSRRRAESDWAGIDTSR